MSNDNVIQVISNGIQFLTNDQIDKIINIIDKDCITPAVKDKYDEIKSSEEFKEQYNKIKEITLKASELNISYFKDSNNSRDIEYLTLCSLNYRDDVSYYVRQDIKALLSLLSPSSIEDIKKECNKYINDSITRNLKSNR